MVLAYKLRWFFRVWYLLLVSWNMLDFILYRSPHHKAVAIVAACAAIVWLLLELKYLRRAFGIIRLTGNAPGFTVHRGAVFTVIGEPRLRSLHKAWANSEGVAEVLVEELRDG